ncbi:hypothetical protein LSH36_295g03080, partial [Paralvinella palmiformis]
MSAVKVSLYTSPYQVWVPKEDITKSAGVT